MPGRVHARNVLLKHVRGDDTYYVDLSPLLETNELVTSIIEVTSDDAALLITSAAVLASDIIVRDEYGEELTISAGKGVKFDLDAGTVNTQLITPAYVTIEFTKNTGKEDAIDCELFVMGEA